MKSERIVTFTPDELKALQGKAGPRDWTRFDGITDAELARLVADDPDEGDDDLSAWIAGGAQAATLTGVEPDLLRLLPPPGPARNAEISRIVRDHLKRKAARLRQVG
jgi:hypothetical protein